MAEAHVFVTDVERPALAPSDRHHLERVLRLRYGDLITVSDGEGRWRPCRFGPELEAAGDVVEDPRPSPPIAVGFALTKGERPEWTVQKLTEVGVDRIVPFVAARSVVRWTPDQAAAHVERWRRIAREAASQSRRTWLPTVEEVASFDELVGCPGTVLAERDGSPPTLNALNALLVLVGPEGGWADEERARAAAVGTPTVALGIHVLRAETGAVVAGALLAALRAGIVQNVQIRPES